MLRARSVSTNEFNINEMVKGTSNLTTAKKRRKTKDDGSRSTFKVLMKHVIVDQSSGAIDVRGVFSQECFKEWLSTRRTSVIQPEQAFHRVVLTHLRGTDTRKPFPAEIEGALLAALRDPVTNPWEHCFKISSKVGKLGFRQLGYHEKRNKQAKQGQVGCHSPGVQSMISIGESDVGSLEFLLGSAHEAFDQTDFADNLSEFLPFEDLSTNDLMAEFDDCFVEHENILPGGECLDQAFDSFALVGLPDSNAHLAANTTPWEALTECLKRTARLRFVEELKEAAAPMFDCLPPATSFFLKQEWPSNDPTLDISFLFPHDEVYDAAENFCSGKILLNEITFRIEKADENAKALFNDDLLGTQLPSLFYSLFSFWVTMIGFLDKLSSGQRFVARFILNICGKPTAFTVKVQSSVGCGLVLLHLTNSSSLFPHLLRSTKLYQI